MALANRFRGMSCSGALWTEQRRFDQKSYQTGSGLDKLAPYKAARFNEAPRKKPRRGHLPIAADNAFSASGIAVTTGSAGWVFGMGSSLKAHSATKPKRPC